MEITLTVTICDDEAQGFVDLLCGCPKGEHGGDMLLRGFSGYWLTGMAHKRTDSGPVWLVIDREDMTPEQYEAAMNMSRDECHAMLDAAPTWDHLPECFYVMDTAAAHRALTYGVQRWGADAFFARCDYGDYDCAVQHALLGEVRYG